MGGNLFPNATRHDNDSYQQKSVMVNDMLSDLDVKAYTIPSLSGKATHGDLDLIVDRQSFNVIAYHYLENNFEFVVNGKNADMKEYSSTNIDVLSFLYDTLQVDLIFIDNESVDFAINYHSYNDLCGIIGCVTKQLGYTLGREGLYQNYLPIDGIGQYKIYLTKNFKEFCKVFDLNDSIFYGADSLHDHEDMLEYLKNWRYFNSDWMNPQLMNATRRNRASKRKTFNIITEMCDELGGIVNHDSAKPSLVEYFDQDFIQRQKDDAYREAKVIQDKKKSFSLERVVEVLGYTPDDVQGLFNRIGGDYGNSLREYTYTLGDEEFKEFILKYV